MSDARPVIFGEVLFDRFPDGKAVLGGAPFNVAWNLQAFGQHPLLISRVGDDAPGRRIRDVMRVWGMDTSGLQGDTNHPTGVVDVSIEGGEPRFDIVADSAYDFLDSHSFPLIERASLLYHGSLALRNPVSRNAFLELRGVLGAPVFLDVNLRSPWWEKPFVLELAGQADWVKLNEAELTELSPASRPPGDLSGAFLRKNGLDTLILTLGAKGAMAVSPDGATRRVEPSASTVVGDTVGAGDAFASVFMLGMLRDWSLETTLERAQEFAGAVVGVRGATAPESDFYRAFSDSWGVSPR